MYVHAGTIAAANITPEEAYVTVPLGIIMDSETAMQAGSEVGDLLRALLER